MKKYLITAAAACILITGVLYAQSVTNVPQPVKAAFAQKYPDAKKVTWETEKGNYEANWGGTSGEDNSALYAPSGAFIEIAKAISVKQLPASAVSYVATHYKGASIDEAALVTDASGKVTYEAEVKQKDIVFDQHGNFVKTEKE